jgi:hypothetical protein
MFAISKAADLNQIVHVGQLFIAFLFSEGSLAWPIKVYASSLSHQFETRTEVFDSDKHSSLLRT